MSETESSGARGWPRSTAIIGAGTMGLGVAESFAVAGTAVRLTGAATVIPVRPRGSRGSPRPTLRARETPPLLRYRHLCSPGYRARRARLAGRCRTLH